MMHAINPSTWEAEQISVSSTSLVYRVSSRTDFKAKEKFRLKKPRGKRKIWKNNKEKLRNMIYKLSFFSEKDTVLLYPIYVFL